MFTTQHRSERIERSLSSRERNYNEFVANVLRRFNELISTKIEGIMLDFDQVIAKIAKEFSRAIATIRRILKRK